MPYQTQREMLEAAAAMKTGYDPRAAMKQWPYNLFADLFGEDEVLHVWPDRLDYLIDRLRPRQQLVLRMRYQKHMTYQQIGDEIGRSRERVRQIVVKSLRTLRRPSFRRKLLSVPMERHAAVLDENAELLRTVARLRAMLPDPPGPPEPAPEPEDVLAMTLADLQLSVRSYNALTRAGIRTVGDIVGHTPDEIMSCRNLGRKSYLEITSKIGRLGLSLASPDGMAV